MAVSARASGREIRPARGSETKPRRILAIDYGRKRMGLALSDELGLTAQPLGTLERSNRRNDLRRLREICRIHAVALILVGHPVHLSGEAGEMAAEVKRFGARLEKDLGIPVELMDERLTTWEAEQTMAQLTSSAGRKRGALDPIAAAVLLREYLAQRQARSQRVSSEKE